MASVSNSVAIKPEHIPEGIDQLTYSATTIDLNRSTVGRAASIEVSLSFGVKVGRTEIDHWATTDWIPFIVRGMKCKLNSVIYGEPEIVHMARLAADGFSPPDCRRLRVLAELRDRANHPKSPLLVRPS